jgi:hypothetical protein
MARTREAFPVSFDRSPFLKGVSAGEALAHIMGIFAPGHHVTTELRLKQEGLNGATPHSDAAPTAVSIPPEDFPVVLGILHDYTYEGSINLRRQNATELLAWNGDMMVKPPISELYDYFNYLEEEQLVLAGLCRDMKAHISD